MYNDRLNRIIQDQNVKPAPKGSALITALFMMTLIAIAATGMTMRLQLDIYRTQLTLSADQQYNSLQFGEFWAMTQLKNPKYIYTGTSPQILQLPKRLSNITAPYQLSVTVYDLQSRLNINNLIEPKYILSLDKLLDKTNHLNKDEQRQLILATHYWIRPYQVNQPQADMLSYYLAQNPPYLPAHQLLKNISEFRLIKGVTPTIYRKLLPYLTALPETTPINMNTASQEVLSTLGYGLKPMQINQIIKARGKSGISNPQKLTILLDKLKIQPELVTIKSTYFLCHTVSRDHTDQHERWAILKRTMDKKGRLFVSLISEAG